MGCAGGGGAGVGAVAVGAGVVGGVAVVAVVGGVLVAGADDGVALADGAGDGAGAWAQPASTIASANKADLMRRSLAAFVRQFSRRLSRGAATAWQAQLSRARAI
jgi:hypothetical protein